MAEPVSLQEARSAYAARRWRAAYSQLAAADDGVALPKDDLERFATASYLIGEEREALELWARLHHLCAEAGELDTAARWGFWIGLLHLLAGRPSQATGWCGTAERMLPPDGEGSAAGFGCIIDGLMRRSGTPPLDHFDRAIDLATSHHDTDLLAVGLLSRGQALVRTGNTAEGMRLLDEAMVAVTSGNVAPVLTGVVYCAIILTCQSVFDLDRSAQWSRELDAWCTAQPDLVPYRGQCLVHRSELLQAKGDWSAAEREADEALAHLGGWSETVVGRAFYQRGELHRLRGDFGAASEMFREADLRGFPPQPGAARLLLAEGRIAAALSSLQAALDVASDRRLHFLGPLVEILVAAGDLEPARAIADELTAAAVDLGAPLLDATALHARGRLLLAEGKPRPALTILGEALILWRRLGSPYEIARTRTALGEAQFALGDGGAALSHVEAAREAFARLGAAPDLARAAALLEPPERTGRLTSREAEVLAHVAGGETNRQIAVALGISEHTVARHLSNIFDKTGTGNRTEASVFAERKGLV